jgi:hypothetical protein
VLGPVSNYVRGRESTTPLTLRQSRLSHDFFRSLSLCFKCLAAQKTVCIAFSNLSVASLPSIYFRSLEGLDQHGP